MSHIVKSPCDEAVILAAPETGTKKLTTPTAQAALSNPAKHIGSWVLVATILGSSMAFIDGTVVN
ncbi:MAG TPA: hypothetical protein VFZ02_10025, partial [Ktedonobacteraceae bacterium]